MGRANYSTAVAVMAMASAKAPRFQEPITKAVDYLRTLVIMPGSQTSEGDTIDQDHPFRGGVSYGKHGRPDMSNVSFWMQAMEEAGVPGDDPAVQEAVLFVSRTQNLSETNDRPFAQAGISDGGFIYAPALAHDLSESESKAGPGPGGKGLRSYGSMTYAGFKSLLYSAVDRDDPRVKGAYGWILQNWDMDHNPNMPDAQSQQGLYYYYHIFAKALRAWGEPVLDTDEGQKNWRHELIRELADRVEPEGAWTNPEDRWNEASPVLVTSYSVLALQEALAN
jgi:squalene-hopene/tetraprenyl-beta-curcumene cyclase